MHALGYSNSIIQSFIFNTAIIKIRNSDLNMLPAYIHRPTASIDRLSCVHSSIETTRVKVQ